MTMKETEQLNDFYMKLSGIVTNIHALQDNMEEAYIVKKLLHVVSTKFL